MGASQSRTTSTVIGHSGAMQLWVHGWCRCGFYTSMIAAFSCVFSRMTERTAVVTEGFLLSCTLGFFHVVIILGRQGMLIILHCNGELQFRTDRAIQFKKLARLQVTWSATTLGYDPHIRLDPHCPQGRTVSTELIQLSCIN